MTYVDVTIWECDVHGCNKTERVVFDDRRREPPKGWTSTADGDFCPDHKENAEETEAALE